MAKMVVGLADAIEALRTELALAITAGQRNAIRFAPEPIELTVQVAVTREANGKIGWSMIGLGGSYKSADTQTLVLRLTPMLEKDDGTLTSDFTIAGVSVTGDQVGPVLDRKPTESQDVESRNIDYSSRSGAGNIRQ
ncbi:hypothetical protein FRACA_2450002 [Frankia canadensis]|uniref:Trypsin-co-occurring domain-containing protein n=1 Tax=Frankia canadensis TaxID=1836972 RepID=A0A2I2KRU0_9ACTN|nr:hypothetical protein FRACA_2450002 [Frankia canadensis]SOU55678.1 hypothetical protein FRACA_2450002 [Frankia canadensis]